MMASISQPLGPVLPIAAELDTGNSGEDTPASNRTDRNSTTSGGNAVTDESRLRGLFSSSPTKVSFDIDSLHLVTSNLDVVRKLGAKAAAEAKVIVKDIAKQKVKETVRDGLEGFVKATVVVVKDLKASPVPAQIAHDLFQELNNVIAEKQRLNTRRNSTPKWLIVKEHACRAVVQQTALRQLAKTNSDTFKELFGNQAEMGIGGVEEVGAEVMVAWVKATALVALRSTAPASFLAAAGTVPSTTIPLEEVGLVLRLQAWSPPPSNALLLLSGVCPEWTASAVATLLLTTFRGLPLLGLQKKETVVEPLTAECPLRVVISAVNDLAEWDVLVAVNSGVRSHRLEVKNHQTVSLFVGSDAQQKRFGGKPRVCRL